MGEIENTPATAGQLLSAARRARGLELPALAAATRISEQFLAAFEADEHDLLPPLYMRSFLRTYAAALGLSGDEVLARIDGQAAGAGAPAGTTPVWEQEVAVRRVDAGGSRRWLRWVAIPVVAVAVVFVAMRLLDHSGRRVFGGGLGPADSLVIRAAPVVGAGGEPTLSGSSAPATVDADSTLPIAAESDTLADSTFAPRP